MNYMDTVAAPRFMKETLEQFVFRFTLKCIKYFSLCSEIKPKEIRLQHMCEKYKLSVRWYH